MKFREIAGRLTGLSTPIFGVSWNPPVAEVTVARRVVSALGDRCVLYNPSELEIPDHCFRSVIEIRHMLTYALEELGADGSLAESLRAMRAACRKFLNTVQADERIVRYGAHPGHYANWHFNSALGELRGVFGVHLAQIAARYGLDIEDELAIILPAKADSDERP